jgi:hypothetical protein
MNGAVPPLPLYTFMACAGTLPLLPPLFKHVVCTHKNRLNNYDICYLHFVSTVERNSVGKACECITDAYLFKNTVSSVIN